MNGNDVNRSLMDEAIATLGENRARFDEASRLQHDVWNGARPQRQPLLLACPASGPFAALGGYNDMETHYHREKMLSNGLKAAISACDGAAEAVPSVRADMGCGVFAALLGVKQELFSDKRPWVLHHLDRAQLQKMGPEDIKCQGEFAFGLEHMAYMAQRLDSTGCRVFPMDLQGPMDMAHLVYGDRLFYEVYDDPAFAHHVLELCTKAIIRGMELCLRAIPGSAHEVAHYNGVVMPRSLGGIKISEDTSTLFSRDMIQEFVIPYTARVLDHFGGGYIHYCGHNKALLGEILRIGNVRGLNLGNPDMHDMEDVLRRCAANKKVYYGSIPKEPGEETGGFFRRVCAAASGHDRVWLLLAHDCPAERRDEILEAWRSNKGH